MVTRKRYVELTTVADDVIDYLKRAKVKREEACVVREISERLWSLEFLPEAKEECPSVLGQAEGETRPSDRRR